MKSLTSIKKKLNQLVRLSIALVTATGIVGCSGGNPYIENADRNEIITLGDSVFDKDGFIQANLESWAGETFRDYTKNAAELAGGILSNSVTRQYSDARDTDSNIETIVMNGGGNDILIPAKALDPYGCRTRWYRPNITNRCVRLVENTYVDAVDLLDDMANDGVSNVLYLGYYHPKGSDANLSQAVDTGNLYLEYACEVSTNANCSFTASSHVMTPADILDDDIHPNATGGNKLANLLWPKLQPLL